eukprot:jgi/Tetstr1/423697/TSEL_014331.t1
MLSLSAEFREKEAELQEAKAELQEAKAELREMRETTRERYEFLFRDVEKSVFYKIFDRINLNAEKTTKSSNRKAEPRKKAAARGGKRKHGSKAGGRKDQNVTPNVTVRVSGGRGGPRGGGGAGGGGGSGGGGGISYPVHIFATYSMGHPVQVGSGLMTLAPAVSVLSPTVGAGFAAAGAAAQGIGVLGDVGMKALSGGGVDFGQAKAAYGQTVPAYNGTTFGGQQTILSNIPCGRRGYYLNTRMSYLRFSVKNKDTANTFKPDYTAASFIQSVVVPRRESP